MQEAHPFPAYTIFRPAAQAPSHPRFYDFPYVTCIIYLRILYNYEVVRFIDFPLLTDNMIAQKKQLVHHRIQVIH